MSTSSRFQALCDAVIDLDHNTLASLYFPKIEEYPALKKLADETVVHEITATGKKLEAIDAPETVLDIVTGHQARLGDYISTRATFNLETN